MSLRVKVEFVLFVVLGSVVFLGFAIQNFLLLPRLNPMEEGIAERDMERVIEAIRTQEILLDEFAGNWATKSELAQFLIDRNAEYLDSEFTLERMQEENLSLVYLLDARGSVITGNAIDKDSGRSVLIQEFSADDWSSGHMLFPEDEPGSAIKGVIATNAGPMLVSSHPILQQNTSGQILGRLVVGRDLDARALGRGAMGLRIMSATDPNLSQGERVVMQGLVAGNLRPVSQVTKEIFRVYAVYPDIEGQPALLLRSEVYRNVLSKAYQALLDGLLAQFGIGLVALVILIVSFRRTIMNPLTKLTTHATEIGERGDLSARLGMQRVDEIGVLANEFDSMVEQLEEDMESQKQAEEALRKSEERYALAVEGANDGLWDWDLVAENVHFSARWKSMLGYEEDEIGDRIGEWFDRIHPDDLEQVQSAMDAHLKGQSDHFETELRIRHKGDEYLWVLCRGIAVRDADGVPTRMAGSQSDITLRKIFEEQLRHQALHDSLTNLPNRVLLLDRITQAIRHMDRDEDYMFALLFLDLDRFKVINDSLGHTIGDLLITAIGEKLQACLRGIDALVRETETVGRFGGDKFIILLDNIKDSMAATLVADRIQTVLKKPIEIEGHEIFTSVSIGVVVSEKGYKTPEEVVRNADAAMYRAKARGRARFEIFNADMHSKAMERLQLENDLRRAIENQEFVVYYQPVVSLKDGAVTGFEALVRWQHPERGLIPPIDFIPIAEETRMILSIGAWVMQEACKQTRAWQIELPQARDIHIAVNLSAPEFAQPGLVTAIEKALVNSGLAPNCLNIEITETAMMENMDAVTHTLAKLRNMDIKISIDDFGTGYSSLSYLHRFPTDILKIDQVFIRDMHGNRENTQIVNTIILLAHALEMEVIAEGIEEEDQLVILREFGCELGQGFLFSRPVDVEQATKILESQELPQPSPESVFVS